jgi:mono/diheme cytochrome c family protein
MNLRISLRVWLLETLLLVLSLILCAMVARADGGPAQPGADPSGLDWDASVKECTVSAGQAKAQFTFRFTNSSFAEVQIQSAQSSCFCTVAKLPQTPWPIPAGSNGTIEVSMDLAGKRGTVEKPIHVVTSAGAKTLNARVHVPDAVPAGGFAVVSETTRLDNVQAALSDRQKVFRDESCAQCHAAPAQGKTDGAQLYAAACAICHDAAHRAAMVPDLRALTHPTDAGHWRSWIAHGRAGSLMPAFAQPEGGPLSDLQIEELVGYLGAAIPSRAVSVMPVGADLQTAQKTP